MADDPKAPDEAEGANDNPELVKMAKDGAVLWVHCTNVEHHKTLGWWVVD